MAVPHGATSFNFPHSGPSSPPATPNPTRSRKPSTIRYIATNHGRRHGFPNAGFSPPEHIAPRGLGHQFSYTPLNKEGPPSGSDSNEAGASSKEMDESKIKVASSGSPEHLPALEKRPSITRPVDEDTDFTVEELSEDDIGYDDVEVIRPDQTEDVKSNDGSEVAKEQDIIDALKKLQCGGEKEQEKARLFETAQRQNYVKRKKRWSIGGYKKRSHAQSIGSQSSDNADIDPLPDDVQSISGSTRRIRRRTQGPEDIERPSRTSLMFEDPPREYDELAITDEPPPLLSDSDGEFWSDDEDDDEDEDEDDNEDYELLLPAWLMEIESNPPSRPSTAVSTASQEIATGA